VLLFFKMVLPDKGSPMNRTAILRLAEKIDI